MSDLVLVKYAEYFGRKGDLDSLFVCTRDEYQKLLKFGEIILGEALGKHSEVYGELSEKTLSIKSEDQEFITKLVDVLDSQHDTITGVDIIGRARDENFGEANS